jgi:hypothetical protein
MLEKRSVCACVELKKIEVNTREMIRDVRRAKYLYFTFPSLPN